VGTENISIGNAKWSWGEKVHNQAKRLGRNSIEAKRPAPFALVNEASGLFKAPVLNSPCHCSGEVRHITIAPYFAPRWESGAKWGEMASDLHSPS